MTIKRDNGSEGSYFPLKKTTIHFESVEVNESPEARAQNVMFPHSGRGKRRREMWNANTDLVFSGAFRCSSVLQM